MIAGTLFQLAALAGLASAANTIRVDVGNGGLKFNPNTVTAAAGDIVEFHFFPANHSVVQGDFSNACQPAKTNAFFSGFFPQASGEAPQVFRVTINDTNPIAFYCSQPTFTHCKSGMVGVINPSGSSTLSAYMSAAAAVNSVSNPASVFGGIVTTAASSSGSSTTSSAPAATSSTTSGGGGGGAYGGGGSTGGSGVGSVKVAASSLILGVAVAVFALA